MKRTMIRAWVLLVLFGMPAPGGAATLKGVELPEQVRVEQRVLTLNGIGVRKKFIFSVYVAGLYLQTATRDGVAATLADEPKQITMVFLRDVSADALGEAFEEGFFNNSQERLDALRKRIDRFLVWFKGGVREGQRVEFVYVPTEGTALRIDGTALGVIPGGDFMRALWAVWLGEVPADHDLKRALLGIE